jgi:aminopeptidase-like protein
MNELQQMDQLFDRLFPLFRSITGEGVRQTLKILQEHIPLEIEEVPSGTEVFDWTIPKEWVIREAWIRNSEGRDIINIATSNLHVVNYSEPIDRVVSLAELKEHVFSIPHLPDAVPYVISYYKERWGFCMSHNQLIALPEGDYHVYIDSEKVDGVLNYAQAVMPGRTDKEVLISSYICHPSMANNELSGPIVAAFLYNRLKKWEQREFTYRFVFHPETIGSIAFLAQYGDHLKKHVYSGMVLTCLGGADQPLSYKKSRNEKAPLNELISFMAGHEKRDVHIRPFSPLNGSDERQYCSPGFNLPVGQFSRMIYGKYAGYHNSLDTKETMTIEALLKSVDELEEILQLQELNGYYRNLKPFGEPKLSKYDLYPNINSPTSWRGSTSTLIDNRQHLNQVLMVLNYSDGQHSLVDIASKQNYALSHYQVSLEKLKEAGLIAGPFRQSEGDAG